MKCCALNRYICTVCAGNRFDHMFVKDSHTYYRCKNCGLEMIFPQPSESVLEELYDASYYGAWNLAGNPDIVNIQKKKTFEHLFEQIPVKQGQRILDCGCATGFFLDLVKQEGMIPYGVEVNKWAVLEARRRFSEEQIHEGYFEHSYFDPESFYAVFMSDFIEHTRNPNPVMEKAYSLLQEGGYVVIMTPDASSISRTLMRKNWSNYKTEHLFYFNKQNINRLLEAYGFSAVKSKGARKYLTIDYIHSIFNAYEHPLLTPISNILAYILPDLIRHKPIKWHTGDMIVVARKT